MASGWLVRVQRTPTLTCGQGCALVALVPPVKQENVKVRMDSEMLRALEERAKRHERTVAAEIRLACRKLLEEKQAEVAA